jgi:cell division septation protein DedD
MKTKIILSFLLIPMAFISYFSCSADQYGDEEDTLILKDTIIIKVDSLVKNQRNTDILKLSFVIQLGAFKSKNHADDFAADVKEKLNTNIDIRSSGGVYIVTVGSFKDGNKAEEYLRFIKSKGFDSAFIKNLQ